MPMHHGFLPREGFNMDTIVKVVRTTALNPFVMALPLLLSRYSDVGEKFAILHPKAVSRAKILFYLGLARWVSGYFSSKVINNWTDDEYDWQREIVIVTGGSSGIGARVVAMLSELNIKVIILDIQSPLTETGHNVHFFKCDITSTQQIASVAQQIRAKIGEPTVLINNAGVARGKTILDSTERDVRFTFDVNSLAHYWLVKEYLPDMIKKNHGMVVTVASIASWATAPNMVDYASTKAAALAFHDGLTAELATRYNAPRVRTVIVNQGYTKTPLFEGYNNTSPFMIPTLEADSVAQMIVEQVLTGRSGQIIAPAFASFLPASAALPHWYQHLFRCDARRVMPNWRGKQVVSDLDQFYENKAKEKAGEEEIDGSTVLVGKDTN